MFDNIAWILGVRYGRLFLAFALILLPGRFLSSALGRRHTGGSLGASFGGVLSLALAVTTCPGDHAQCQKGRYGDACDVSHGSFPAVLFPQLLPACGAELLSLESIIGICMWMRTRRRAFFRAPKFVPHANAAPIPIYRNLVRVGSPRGVCRRQGRIGQDVLTKRPIWRWSPGFSRFGTEQPAKGETPTNCSLAGAPVLSAASPLGPDWPGCL